MTKKQLVELIEAFVSDQDDTIKDEWYGTNRDHCETVMEWFKVYIGGVK